MGDLRMVAGTGGVRLACRVEGGPDAAPLVLLHALGEDADSWAPVIGDLAREWRVYAFDHRGHGRSDWPGEYSLELMRDDMLQALDELDLGEAVFVGHSIGGMVSYLLAQERPSAVRALVLEDPAPPMPVVPRRDVPERPEGELGFDWPLVGALYGQRNDPDPQWRRRLDEIKAPTLILAGGPESHIPQDQLVGLADEIPDARLVTIEVGHNIHTSAPARFLRELNRFLA